MATSSIFANITVNDEESAKAIAQAYEDFEAKGFPHRKNNKKSILEPDKIKAFFAVPEGEYSK